MAFVCLCLTIYNGTSAQRRSEQRHTTNGIDLNLIVFFVAAAFVIAAAADLLDRENRHECTKAKTPPHLKR